MTGEDEFNRENFSPEAVLQAAATIVGGRQPMTRKVLRKRLAVAIEEILQIEELGFDGYAASVLGPSDEGAPDD